MVWVSMWRALGCPPGGVDQHGFLDTGEGVEQLADGQVQAVLVGVAAHEVGDLQGEHAGEDVHADVVFGRVVHGAERHYVGGL